MSSNGSSSNGDNEKDNDTRNEGFKALVDLAIDTSKRNATKAKEKLQPKEFAWDESIFYLAVAIIGLSLSNFIVDFFKENKSAVSCFVPPSLGFSTDQVDYVNDYCQKSLPFTAKLPIALIIQGIILLAPHFFWKIVYGGEMDSFFQQAGDLALRDSRTGKYPEENFDAMKYIAKEFKGKKKMLISYCVKLVIQLLLIIAAIIVNVFLFNDSEIKFKCDSANAELQFHNVTCSYAKLQFINILKGTDYFLLCVALLALLWGLFYCFVQSHPELQHSKFAQFCFDVCMNSRYLLGEHVHKLIEISKVMRLEDGDHNDLSFLLLKLFSTNSGAGKMFRSVQVTDDVSEIFNHTLAGTDKYDFYRCDSESVAKVVEDLSRLYTSGPAKNKSDTKMSLPHCIALTCGDIMIKYKQKSSYHVLDVSCGYHRSVFELIRMKEVKQVTSIVLDSHYRSLTEEEDYKYSKLLLLRAPANLSALPDVHTDKLIARLKKHNVKDPFSFIVVGPMDSHARVNTVKRILKLDEFIQDGCVLLIFQPNNDKIKDFVDYRPPKTIHLEENKISKWDTFEYELRDEIMNYFNHSDGWTRIDTRHEDKVIHFRFGAYEYHKATTDSVV
ncbi:uncharacterized protein [Dysidea avara]|uniref:uncharacterized protein isoform X2 n=1 Tax=Dysidea avara TaxID=196820 RepID=UPI0033186F75